MIRYQRSTWLNTTVHSRHFYFLAVIAHMCTCGGAQAAVALTEELDGAVSSLTSLERAVDAYAVRYNDVASMIEWNAVQTFYRYSQIRPLLDDPKIP